MFGRVGFRATSDTVAFICLAFAAIYITKGEGITAFKNSLTKEEDTSVIDEIIKL